MLGYAFMGKAHSRAFARCPPRAGARAAARIRPLPLHEDQVAAVRRSVLQWNFIDSAAAKIDDAALRQAQQEKDAVRAYELVYAALGAE